MPTPSHSNSSPKSNPAPKGSRESAAQTASEAFAARPQLDSPAPNASPSQSGQKRLAGAFMIQLSRIEPDPEQPRKQLDSQHIAELTASIKQMGVLQPISVRYVKSAARYRIIAGQCRFTASQQAGLNEIPAWVRSPEENMILMEQVIENWQRSDLNPFELADSLGILRDANGYSQVQLAEFTGKSKGEISKILSLLELDPEVQQLARSDKDGAVTRRHLYALRDFPVARQLKLIAGIQDGRYTAESLEVLAANDKQKRSDVGRVNNWIRRTFKTRHATVSIQFRQPNPSDHDVLAVLSEVKRQVSEDAAI